MIFTLDARNRVRMASLLLSVGVLAGCSDLLSGFDASDRVRTVFEEYRTAILAKDGETAAARVGEGVISRFDEWRNAALVADRPSLQRLSVGTQIFVLRARLELSRAELQSLSGRGLFVHAVTAGWIPRSSVEGWQTGIATIDDRSASLTLTKGTGEMQMPFVFEQGEWRIDLSPAMAADETELEDRESDPDGSLGEFVEEWLRDHSSEPFDPAVWDGPLD